MGIPTALGQVGLVQGLIGPITSLADRDTCRNPIRFCVKMTWDEIRKSAIILKARNASYAESSLNMDKMAAEILEAGGAGHKPGSMVEIPSRPMIPASLWKYYGEEGPIYRG